MRILAVLVCIVGTLVACDPIRQISVSRAIVAPIPQSCILRVLRSAEQVRSADISDGGIVYADLHIPRGFESHIPPGFESKHIVKQLHFQAQEERRDGELQLVFLMAWVGSEPTKEYREFATEVMSALQALVVVECGEK